MTNTKEMIVSSHMYNAATGYYHNIIKSLTTTSVIYIIKYKKKVEAYVSGTVDNNSRNKQTQSMNARESTG